MCWLLHRFLIRDNLNVPQFLEQPDSVKTSGFPAGTTLEDLIEHFSQIGVLKVSVYWCLMARIMSPMFIISPAVSSKEGQYGTLLRVNFCL